MTPGLDAVVVLPTYNESQNVRSIIERLLQLPGVGVLVVDDGSPDGTGDIAEEALETHDLVIGSRYVQGVSVQNWPLRRILLSAFANRYIRGITGLRAHDMHFSLSCSFRLTRMAATSARCRSSLSNGAPARRRFPAMSFWSPSQHRGVCVYREPRGELAQHSSERMMSHGRTERA